MVVVFPRCTAAGGTVPRHELVDKPLTRAKRIFHTFSCDSKSTCERLKHIKSDDEAVRMELYQQDIRDRFIEILTESGLEASQFASIDHDEDFLKIHLPERGPTIEFMADTLHYLMPLDKSVYKGIEAHHPYPGGHPLPNNDSQDVLAYAEFSRKEKNNFQDFRSIDSVRILSFWLHEWVSLDEMERQGVVSCHFPCPDQIETQKIHDELLSARKWLTLSPHHSAVYIREYFGEEIAFFIGFLGHLCRSFFFPGVVGLLFLMVTLTITMEGHRLDGLRTFLCVPLSVWAASTLHMFERKTARIKQVWGVNEREAREMPNPDWDPDHTGECGKVLSSFITVCFIAIYVAVISALLAWQFQSVRESKAVFQGTSLILSILIKAGGLAWRYLAPLVVSLENRRTLKGYDDQLAFLLSGVKLLMTNFPFFYSCFLTNLVETQCGQSFQEVASKVWIGYNESLIDSSVKEALLKYSFTWETRFRSEYGTSVCINGCFPPDWQHARADSRTNCDYDVSANLLTYFVFMLVLDTLFLIWPIVMARWEMHKEYRKVQDSDSGESDLPYSILQWEAKKFRYIYDSWGGDRVNDFLDLAVAYSVVACWGCIVPPIATLALIVLFICLHLRIYRMLYVTRRPYPHASAGLGIWKSIFLYINKTAVACNVALAAIFFYPMRLQGPGEQLILFIVAEHALLLLQEAVYFFIPEEPSDVISIKYFNRHVLAVLQRRRDQENLIPLQKSVLNHIDLTLNPDGLNSECSDDSSEGSQTARSLLP
ncbi:unnamed protein product [Durusdinium trenchii]